MTTETITWHPISEPPDSDLTVMIFPDPDGEAWLGFLDGETWRYADGMPVTPTHWANVPKGPTP